MKEHGIAFSPAMLEAIRAGKKTQTRQIRPRRIVPGDRIWVKEALQKGELNRTTYASDGACVCLYSTETNECKQWQRQRDRLPAMFMPRWAARTWLEVTAVRAERLQAITEDDARQEGCPPEKLYPGTWYAILWNSLHEKSGERWDDNPLVQVIEFKLIGWEAEVIGL